MGLRLHPLKDPEKESPNDPLVLPRVVLSSFFGGGLLFCDSLRGLVSHGVRFTVQGSFFYVLNS